MEANAKTKDKQLAQKSQIDPSGLNTNVVDESAERKSSVQERNEEGGSSGSEGEAGPASDGEQTASQPQMPQQEVSFSP